ncbi:MAG: GAF domain-containing protein [Acidobacteriia bacterium]|nr:GAF domain-containing protein [Terriglobia bacterium]
MTSSTPVLEAIEALVSSRASDDRVLDETVRLLKENFAHYTWVGIYWVEGNDLVLKTYLGKPSPHTRIPIGKGICGAAVAEKRTVNVPDVNADPRYLACSIETRSEIVIPIQRDSKIFGEIDIDSDVTDAFQGSDQQFLEAVASLLASRF